MPKAVLTVTLNPAIDKIIDVTHYSSGRTYFAEGERFSAGGKGINVARTLKNFGVDTLATGLIGIPAGAMVLATLKKERIRHDFLKVRADTRVNLIIEDREHGEIVRVLEPGPEIPQVSVAVFRAKFGTLLKRCGCVVLSGRPHRGKNADKIYYELIRTAQAKDIPCFLDTHGRALALGIKAKPFGIKPNLAEAEDFFQERLDAPYKLKRAVRYFLRMGVANVLISLEKDGVVGSNGQGIWRAATPPVSAGQTVGCGDTFLAAFVFAVITKRTFPKALQLATAAGRANLDVQVPGNVSPGAVQRFLKTVRLTTI